MKHSIRVQLPAVWISLMAVTIGIILLVNTLFLEDRYMRYKQELMETTCDKLDAFVKDTAHSDAFTRQMRAFSEEHNINIIILQGDSLLFSTTREELPLAKRLRDYLSFGGEKDTSWREASNLADGSSPYDLDTQIKDWQLDRNVNAYGAWCFEMQTISSTDRFQVAKAYDPVSGAYYLECYGRLSEGCSFLMRTPFQSMAESAYVSNRFTLFTGLAAILASALLALLISNRLIAPLESLNQIAKKMSHLDFTQRYEGKESNEIGELGRSVNSMSEHLESAVSELKTANLALKSDLESRVRQDEAREEFIANVSHDLKTPISIIQGYAEGLKDHICQTREDEDVYLDVILDESQKMSRLVKKLLFLNQLQSGGEKPEVAYFDMTEAIRRAVSSYRILIDERGISLNAPSEQCPVWGDEFMLGEAISNYISNAYHYAKEGGEIRIFYEKPSADTVRVCVFNNGEPIPEEDREKIWSKFYRADKARTREYGGNGLGLSIVREVAEKHNHIADFRNEENGVTFFLEVDAG